MLDTKTLMTCTEAVFRKHILCHRKKKYLVQFSDDANSITAEDKPELLVKYNLDVYVFPVKHMQKHPKCFQSCVNCSLKMISLDFMDHTSLYHQFLTS